MIICQLINSSFHFNFTSLEDNPNTISHLIHSSPSLLVGATALFPIISCWKHFGHIWKIAPFLMFMASCYPYFTCFFQYWKKEPPFGRCDTGMHISLGLFLEKWFWVCNTFQTLLFLFTVWKVDRWNIFFNWRKLSLSFHCSVFETIYFLKVMKKIFNYLLIISNLIINHLTIIYFVLNFYFYFVFDNCNEIFNISCQKRKISSIKINQ